MTKEVKFGYQINNNIHPWLQKLNVCFIPGDLTPVLKELMSGMREEFQSLGHNVQENPDPKTEVIITTAPYGRSLGWREALIFNIRRLYKLSHTPTFYTMVQISPDEFKRQLDHLTAAIEKDTPEPLDFQFPGVKPEAYQILYEQGKRGGPILAFERVIQVQAKSIRVLLVVADDQVDEVYHFDLVGAYPRSVAKTQQKLYRDIVLRIVTSMSTVEVKEHQVVGEPVSLERWMSLSTPQAMVNAGDQIGLRDFFTDTVRIADIVDVPLVSDVIAEQYSEGCFATWDPELDALIATVTGSARPVHKGNLRQEDLAIVVDVRPDGMGAQVRVVDGRQNDPPSTEAVELIDMDKPLPWVKLGEGWETQTSVPIVRSKLHGHRGIKSYDPRFVEYVPLDPPYYHYPVSCATDAQAQGIKSAFSHSETLNEPDDPRPVAFTVLPGHGVVIVEKWVAGKQPFQTIWEFMDAGYLEIDNLVPQGKMSYHPTESGKMVLTASE